MERKIYCSLARSRKEKGRGKRDAGILAATAIGGNCVSEYEEGRKRASAAIFLWLGRPPGNQW
jgi:hypothetical protein